jgi:hypothetical protein
MKKMMLFVAAVAIAASASVSLAQAKGIGGPGMGGKNNPNGPYTPGGGFGGGGYPNKPGCCGGFTPHHHWGWGGGISVGLVSNAGGECYYVRRNVVVPGLGVVSKRQLVCE